MSRMDAKAKSDRAAAQRIRASQNRIVRIEGEVLTIPEIAQRLGIDTQAAPTAISALRKRNRTPTWDGIRAEHAKAAA